MGNEVGNEAIQTNGGASEIEKNAIILSVTIGKPGTRRKVKGSQVSDRQSGGDTPVEVDADASLVHVSKDILDCPEYEKIQKIDGKFKAFLRARCSPSFFKSSMYLLPFRFIDEVDQGIVDYLAERKPAIEEFIAVYPKRVEESPERLRGLFELSDYPPQESMKAAFYVATRYLTLSTPTSLRGLRRDIFEREKNKAEKFWKEATVEVQNALRESMAKLVSHIVERLTESGDGKKKKFYDSNVEKLEEFFESFEKRNIAGDAEMTELVKRAKAVIGGVSPEKIRTDMGVRETVRAGFEKVKTSLDAMITDRPSRRIVFEDE